MMKTSWMREDTSGNVKQMLSAAEKAEALRQNKNRYKIIADLMLRGKSEDITQDAGIFLAVNKPRSLEDDERLCFEEYMKFFPQDCQDALEMAAERRSADEKDFNRNSKAWWRMKGYIPAPVMNLIVEIYPDKDERVRAIDRFFNMFPKFRISTKAI